MVTVTSFGYGHNPAPQADITLDLRHNLRNPHHDLALRYMTGLDTAVRQHVLDTPGARTIVDHTAALVSGLLATHQPVSVATGCVGGRHRSVAIAEEIADALREAGVSVHVDHRDLSKPVIQYDEPVTRTYTHPDVLTTGVRERWADPETDPTRIDWAPRQAAAAIPFEVVDGRPLNPHAPTGIRYGRNQLGHWGEQLCADAIVTAFAEEGRWLLMVERGDGYGWALPGGTADPGETPEVAALRELREETGLRLGGVLWHVLPARYVPDPRASDEAWMVTVPVRTHLGTMPRDYLPTVVGADDARRAEWVRADSFTVLVRHLAKTYQGQVFAAHEAMLSELLGRQHG